jgi:fructose-1,6-bisphosphatase/inositol monophosphatase family enzyme
VGSSPFELVKIGLKVATDCLSSVSGDSDWTLTKAKRGQHVGDVIADKIAVEVLTRKGFNVYSEESGLSDVGGAITAIIDPIDGSTNASRHIPYWASSICFVDDDGPIASVVSVAPAGFNFSAVRGEGAWLDGKAIVPSTHTDIRGSIIFVNGFPTRRFVGAQIRALGSAATELAMVACGWGDGFVDFSDGLAVWDFAGASLLLSESGAVLSPIGEDDITYCFSEQRQRLCAAATRQLSDNLRVREGFNC